MKVIVLAQALVALAFGQQALHAEQQPVFPLRRVEIVVPLTPGSAPDTLARTIGERLAQRLGQTVLVTNRPGAATQIAMAYLKRASPDGHTLMLMHSGMIATGLVYKTYEGDVLKDHTFVAAISATPYVIGVHRSLPVNTIAEFATYAKDNSSKLNFGSTGGAYDIDANRVQQAMGFKAEIIPYPGASQMIIALAANQVQVAAVSLNSVRNMLKDIKLLAVLSPKRLAQAPGVPTLDESGYPNVYGGFWYGIVGPPGMAPALTQRLNREINDILTEPAVRKQIAEVMTNDVLGGTPADFERLARQSYDAYSKAATKAHIVPQ